MGPSNFSDKIHFLTWGGLFLVGMGLDVMFWLGAEPLLGAEFATTNYVICARCFSVCSSTREVSFSAQLS